MTSTSLVHNGPPPSAAIAPLDTNRLKQQLLLLEDPERLELQQRLSRAYDVACASLIGPGDVQIDGKNKDGTPRVFKKKSAWQKLGRHFSISTSIVRESIEFVGDGPDREFLAKCVVRGESTWGQVTEAVAACGSDEESGRRTITMADAVATAQTRATNRAISNLIAMGEVSAEEIGQRAATGDDRPRRATEPELTLETALEITYPWKNPPKYHERPLSEVSTRQLLMISKWAKGKIDAGDASASVQRLYRAAVLITESRPDLEAVIAAMEKGNDAPAAAPAVDPRQTDLEQAIAKAGQAPAVSADPNDAPVVQTGAPPAAAEVRVDVSGASDAQDDDGAPDDDAPGGAGEHDATLTTLDAGPLVPELEEPTPVATLQQLSVQLIALLDDPRTPADVRDKYLAKAGAGQMRTEQQYRRAIGELTLTHEIGA